MKLRKVGMWSELFACFPPLGSGHISRWSAETRSIKKSKCINRVERFCTHKRNRANLDVQVMNQNNYARLCWRAGAILNSLFLFSMLISSVRSFKCITLIENWDFFFFLTISLKFYYSSKVEYSVSCIAWPLGVDLIKTLQRGFLGVLERGF